MSEQKNNGYQLPKDASFEDWRNSCEYEKVCNKCKQVYKVWTQKDEDPEYYTDVLIICDCGDKVHFKLPVN